MNSPGFAALVVLWLFLVPAYSQGKPAESTSKIRKVLLYNKVGGWVSVSGMAAVKQTFSKLSAAKGFELVQLDTDTDITLDYLRQFQVIVWNNNTNGGASVPSASARQAVLDYLHQGGGWMLICFAGDHANSWEGLTETLGASFTRHAAIDRGEVVLDGAARDHGELQWMVQGYPEVFELNQLWFSFNRTVRPLPGVTVIATSRSVPGKPNVIVPQADGKGDNTYIWAREVGNGRLIYNAIGFGQVDSLGRTNLFEQQDSIVPRLYWQNARYAAGDFQNGCTTPGSPAFDPAARVHVEAMCTVTGLEAGPARSELLVSKGGLRMRISTSSGPLRVRLRDLRGAMVRDRTLPAGTGEIALDDALVPGVYHLEIRGSGGAVRRRLLLP